MQPTPLQLPPRLTVSAVAPHLRRGPSWFGDVLQALVNHAAAGECLLDVQFFTGSSERQDSRVRLAADAWEVAADPHFAASDLVLFELASAYPLLDALTLRPRGARVVVAWEVPDTADEGDWNGPGTAWRLADQVLVSGGEWLGRLSGWGVNAVPAGSADACGRAVLTGLAGADPQLRRALAQARTQFLRDFSPAGGQAPPTRSR